MQGSFNDITWDIFRFDAKIIHIIDIRVCPAIGGVFVTSKYSQNNSRKRNTGKWTDDPHYLEISWLAAWVPVVLALVRVIGFTAELVDSQSGEEALQRWGAFTLNSGARRHQCSRVTSLNGGSTLQTFRRRNWL